MPRILLVPYVALSAVIGLAYLLGGPERTESHAFDVAKGVAPMHVWGFLFLIGAFTIGLALAFDQRPLVAWALFIGGGIYTWWATLFLLSGLTDHRASLTAWSIHGFIAFVHFVGSWRVKVSPW